MKLAYDVFVATPDTPLMEACAPRVPSRNSRFACTGSPVRVRPMATLRSMRRIGPMLGRLISFARVPALRPFVRMMLDQLADLHVARPDWSVAEQRP